MGLFCLGQARGRVLCIRRPVQLKSCGFRVRSIVGCRVATFRSKRWIVWWLSQHYHRKFLKNGSRIFWVLSFGGLTGTDEEETEDHESNVNDTVDVQPEPEGSATRHEHEVRRTVVILYMVELQLEDLLGSEGSYGWETLQRCSEVREQWTSGWNFLLTEVIQRK